MAKNELMCSFINHFGIKSRSKLIILIFIKPVNKTMNEIYGFITELTCSTFHVHSLPYLIVGRAHFDCNQHEI